ncbi:alpha/beta hydrolase fold domain-containing protein [Oceanobacillus kapialis]|uniref:Alpha/beta hydrolase fold domain-containing protein n=1 Tax=Oceanobacillus kapialis TaxID=481353 RepID=A0ABW5Q433_9BACI
MRSIRSWAVEQILRRAGGKKTLTDEVRYLEYMKERQVENGKPYVLPEKWKNKFKIERLEMAGMDYYVFNQENEKPDKTILYLHGGGYVDQPLVYHWKFLNIIARQTHATIYVPVYPKAPNHQYQESFDKVLPLYEEILAKSDSSKLILMGDSAGGGFALALAQLLLEKGIPQPKHIILLSPWLDISLENPDIQPLDAVDPTLGIYGLKSMGKAYAGDTNPNHYLVSPLNGEVRGLGKITLFVGTHEIFLPDARKFKQKAEDQGVRINYFEYPKMNHVFPLYPIPEAKKATGEMVYIINSR